MSTPDDLVELTPEAYSRVEELAEMLLLFRADQSRKDWLLSVVIARAVFDEDLWKLVKEVANLDHVPDVSTPGGEGETDA